MKKLVVIAAISAVCGGVQGAGFGLYETSARGNALGGTLVGSTKDASANYYNPANMSETTNYSFLVGATFLNPFCDVKVAGVPQNKMNSGWFADPSIFFTIPLPFDFTFGWGNYTEYGLGTKYANGWALAGDTRKTTMEQFTFNPNLSYKVFDWWSVAAGVRMSYITFENWKQPHNGEAFYYSDYGMVLPQYGNAYHLNSHLKGDDWDAGYNLATTFKVRDDLSFGVVYRSRIRHNIKGHFDLDGGVDTPLGRVGQSAELPASAKLTLPQSITLGGNWDATERWHLGAAVTWTEWSSVEQINFKIPNYGYSLPLKWNDVWRFGLGTEYDITDYLAGRVSYVYDMDPCKTGTTMLPGGNRHIPGVGLGWKIMPNLRLDVGYNLVVQRDSRREITLTSMSGQTTSHHFSTRNSFAHMASVSVAYEF